MTPATAGAKLARPAKRDAFSKSSPFRIPQFGENEFFDELVALTERVRLNHPAWLSDADWKFVDEARSRLMLTAGQLRRFIEITRRLSAIEAEIAS